MKRFFSLLAPLLFLSHPLNANDYITYIGGLKAQALQNGGVLRFQNISINLPVLISGLIAAKALPPKTAIIFKKLQLDRVGPLDIEEIRVTFQGNTRYIELSAAKNEAIKWQKITFINSPTQNVIKIENLVLSSPVLNQIYISPIEVKKLTLKTTPKGFEISGGPISLLGGSISSFKVELGGNSTLVRFEDINNLSLKEAIKLASFFAKVPVKVEGSLSVKRIEIEKKTSIPSVEIKNLSLQQEEGGIEFDKIRFDKKGLLLEGVIDNFALSLPTNTNLYLSGDFQKGKFYENKFSLETELKNLTASLKGKFNLSLKGASFVIDDCKVDLYPQKGNTTKEENPPSQKGGGVDLASINATLPALPFDFSLLVKRLEVNPHTEIPHIRLKPLRAEDIEFSYTKGIYTAHAAVCYTDLFLNADTQGNTYIGVLTLNNPLSAIVGCFIEDIDLPFLKKVFFNGRLNAALFANFQEGKLSTLKGLYEISLYNGYIFVRKDLQLEGAIGRVYNALRSILGFLGIDYPTLEYNLYSSGYFYAQGNAFKFDSSAYLLAESPISVTFAGLVGGVYNLYSSRGVLNVRGYTKLPVRSIKIRRTLRLGSPSY